MSDLEDFIAFKRERDVKELTLKHYRQVIGWVLKTAREMRINDDPRTMTAQEFRAIIKGMNALDSSVGTTVTIFKMFLKFVGNPLDVRFLLNKGERPNARWISEDTFVRTLNGCEDPTIKIILHLGGNYGLRRIEIARLTFDDIKADHFIIHGKGHGEGKIRKVPRIQNDAILEEYVKWREWIPTQAKNDKSGDRFVVTFCESNRTITKFEPQSITGKMRRFFKENGIDASTHSLRREFVTSAYRSGADLITIQRLVGHNSPTTTEKYIESDENAAIRAMNQRNNYISMRTMT